MRSHPTDPSDLAVPLRLAARIGPRLRLLAIGLVAVTAFGLWWSGVLGSIVEPERIRRIVEAAGPAAPVAFILLLIPLNPVLLAGAPIWISSTLFPLHLAIVYSIVGAVATSAGTHALASHFGSDWAGERIPSKLHGFRDRIESSPLKSVATLRMLLWINPGVDLLMAVSQVRMRDYLLGTAIGIALPTAARVYVGHVGIEAMSGSNNWLVWAALALLAVGAIGFQMYRKRRRLPTSGEVIQGAAVADQEPVTEESSPAANIQH